MFSFSLAGTVAVIGVGSHGWQPVTRQASNLTGQDYPPVLGRSLLSMQTIVPIAAAKRDDGFSLGNAMNCYLLFIRDLRDDK
jgi:hypothetical protein